MHRLHIRCTFEYTLYPKNVHLFISQITLSKINRFWWFLVSLILRKFDINSLYICPPHLYTVATLPWEIQKVIFNSIIYAYFRLFASSQKKTNCYSLIHHTWKMSPQYLVKRTIFFIWLNSLKVCCIPPDVGGSRESRLWVGIGGSEKTVVMFGKWNARQATLQQMFKVTTFCTDTCFQSFSSLINCIVYHAVLKFSPCHNKTLPQLVRVAPWYSIRVKNEKVENVVHFTRYCGDIFQVWWIRE